MLKKYEILPHTADFKIKVYGKDLKDIFSNALLGMFESLKPVSKECKYEVDTVICSKFTVSHEINVESNKLEYLLVDFLSECLYLSDANKEAYFKAYIIDLKENNNSFLKAKIFGVKITGFEAFEIKAVTYHEIELKQIKDGSWFAIVVFDI